MESSSLLHIICEICMGAGGIGTVGTLICMIWDLKRKTKQIETVQQIQSHQLESLYEPDIRTSSYGMGDIVIRNYGENLTILDISELTETKYLNKEGMSTWFPLPFDKDNEIHIPLYLPAAKIQLLRIEITCRNRLGLTYLSSIEINDGKATINRPVIK